MDKYFSLKENVILVKGARRGLIMDLNNKKIFSIDNLSAKYLNQLLKGSLIESVLNSMKYEPAQSFTKYMDLLVKNNLAYYCNTPDSYKTISDIIKKDDTGFNNISTVWLELRKACNLQCCHCYLDCNSSSDKDLNLLKLEEWMHIIDQLKKFNPKRIILIGGEPLLFSNIIELINYASKICSCSQLVLYSNLTLLNDKLIDCILKNNVKVITSIYSNTSEIHDKITNRPGSFNLTVNNIKKLHSLGVYVQANISIMKYNYKNIKDIKDFTYKLTNNKSKIDLIRDVGKSKEYLIPYSLAEYFNKKKTKPSFKGINKKEFIRNFKGNSCWNGKLNITCDGYITPCIMGSNFMKKDFNLKTQNLSSILKEYIIPSFWTLSKNYIDQCSKCEYRYVCKDCRPVCADKDNILAKDISCGYNPYEGVWDKDGES